MRFKTVLFSALLFVAVLVAASDMAGMAYAADPEVVISNSADWRDVYSTVLFSNLQGAQGLFLVGPPHATVILFSIPEDKSVLLANSRRTPFVSGYRGIVESQGYGNVEELTSDSINLELAKRLPAIRNFIVLDDAYGYNAIAVAPYAVVSKSYVIFANDRNARQVETFLAERNPQSVILYGQLDPNVKTRLAKFSPEVINTGDRFDNNIEIVRKYLEIRPTRQVILSNGEFIEAGVMSGADPVLFIGRQNVPDQIKEFLKKSDIEVAILIGNELIASATTIRRQAEVSVFVKFAQGARVPSGTIAAVEDLDRFPMPRYGLRIGLYSIQYNRATNSLEVTFRNEVELGAYLKSTITLFSNGEQFTVGDDNPVFIDKNQYKTFVYTATTDGRPLAFEDESFNATLYTLFGESRRSMENVLTGNFIVQTVEILDGAVLNMTGVAYDPAKGGFVVSFENTGTVDAYVTPELQDLFINGEYLFVASDTPELVKAGKRAKAFIPFQMTEDDISNNQIVKVKSYYGERPQALIKTLYGEFAFVQTYAVYITYGIIILVLLLILLPFLARRKCHECGTRNSIFARRCRKCHALLRKRRKLHNLEREGKGGHGGHGGHEGKEEQ